MFQSVSWVLFIPSFYISEKQTSSPICCKGRWEKLYQQKKGLTLLLMIADNSDDLTDRLLNIITLQLPSYC